MTDAIKSSPHGFGLMVRREAGVLLREKRKAAGMTQPQVARRMGLAFDTYFKIEKRGTMVLRKERWRQLAKILNFDPDAALVEVIARCVGRLVV